MNKKLSFHPKAWDEYLSWQSRDKKTLKRINQLLKDIQRDPFGGISKPEPLRENLSGLWSRRIDDNNRLVYHIGPNGIDIIQCRGHYEDN